METNYGTQNSKNRAKSVGKIFQNISPLAENKKESTDFTTWKFDNSLNIKKGINKIKMVHNHSGKYICIVPERPKVTIFNMSSGARNH